MFLVLYNVFSFDSLKQYLGITIFVFMITYFNDSWYCKCYFNIVYHMSTVKQQTNRFDLKLNNTKTLPKTSQNYLKSHQILIISK